MVHGLGYQKLNSVVAFCNDTDFERLWQVLAGFGRLWQALAGFGGIWQALAGIGRRWQALAGFGRLWRDLAGFGRPCHYLYSLEHKTFFRL